MTRLLEVEDLKTQIRLRRGIVHAVDGLSFEVEAGRDARASSASPGCGKTMAAMSIMRLLPRGGLIAGGEIRLDGRDLAKLSDAELRNVRGNDIGMVFQDPMTSLNPTMTIGKQIAEAVTDPSRRLQGGGDGPRRRGARAGRHAPTEGAARRLPAPAVRRPAPARDDRDGARVRPEAADRRRADDRARRDDPGADPEPARPDQARARDGDHPDHPRHGRDRGARRPRAS